MSIRPQPPEVPARLLGSAEMVAACRDRNLGTVFDLLQRRAGISQSAIARACDMTPGRVNDLLTGRRHSIRDIAVFERVADGLRIPGHMLGLADRAWERDQPPHFADEASEPTKAELFVPAWLGTSSADMGLEPAFLADEISTSLPGHYRTSNLFGARYALELVERHARRIERVQFEADDASLDELLRVGARVAEFLGWLTQDLGDVQSATYWSDRAMEWSQQTGDDQMIAYVLFRKSNQAVSRRKARHAVAFAQAAQRVPGITPRVQALAIQQEAQAHAMLGNPRHALAKFDQAHELAATPDEPDPLATVDTSYCTPTYVEIQRANCLIELGQPDRAVDLFEGELATLPAVYRNDQGVYLSRLARAYVVGGEPERGAVTATKALAITSDTESARALAELAAVDDAMSAWSELSDVADFRTQFRHVRGRITARPRTSQ